MKEKTGKKKGKIMLTLDRKQIKIELWFCIHSNGAECTRREREK